MSQSTDQPEGYVTPEQQRRINEIQEEAKLLADSFNVGFKEWPRKGDRFPLSNGAEATVTRAHLPSGEIDMTVRVPVDDVVIEIVKP
jgi:hypothetical protein